MAQYGIGTFGEADNTLNYINCINSQIDTDRKN